jgi:spore coat polysaccharide biosynthesis protein SpsF
MSAGIIIQARLTSTRFPNKMLCPLLGKPVLQWTIEAVKKTGLPFCIAIPDEKTNWGLAEWLLMYDKTIKVYAGHPNDLIDRFKKVLNIEDFDPIIRVCGDNPFIAPEDITLALELFNKRKYYTRVNHAEVFSKLELDYASLNDPFVGRREHCQLLNYHTVDYPEDIDRLEDEWYGEDKVSPTMEGRKRLWKES